MELTGRVRGGPIPRVDAVACRSTIHAVARALAAGSVLACHDISDGGVATAVAEMAIGGQLGGILTLADVPFEPAAGLADGGTGLPPQEGAHRDLAIAFTESPGRFVCEVPTDREQAFAAALGDVPWAFVGEVCDEPVLEITTGNGGSVRVTVADLAAAWRGLNAAQETV